jgi:hypothetical protein
MGFHRKRNRHSFVRGGRKVSEWMGRRGEIVCDEGFLVAPWKSKQEMLMELRGKLLENFDEEFEELACLD